MKRIEKGEVSREVSGELKTYLTQLEVEKLEAVAVSPRDKLLIRLLFHLGCRVSEVLALEVSDIDFRRGTVMIEHLKARISLSCPTCGAKLGKKHRFCPQCSRAVEKALSREREEKKRRILYLDRGTLLMLREYITQEHSADKIAGKIFTIGRFMVWTLLKRYGIESGLPRLVNPTSGREHWVSPHRLRDAFAIMAVKRGDSIEETRMLQEQLGHASFNTTMRYRKVSGEELQKWYEDLWKVKDLPQSPTKEKENARR